MTEHLDLELSAYLDGALGEPERAAVEGHLAGCRMCAARLSDLRATASLIGALPSPRPTRSLVPSLEPRWSWLRPLRSLSTVASGAFLFLFLASAVLESGSGLGGGGAGSLLRQSEPASAPGAVGQPAQPTGTAAPPAETPPSAAGSPETDARSAEDAASPSPTDAELAIREEQPRATAADDAVKPSLGPPSLWLVLGLASGILAFFVHRRVRAA